MSGWLGGFLRIGQMGDGRSMREFFNKTGQVLWQAALGFKNNHCALRASALSMYSLFAIVPVMAMAFGLAKGFGFQQFFESEVMSLFAGQEEIISRVLDFSNNLLGRTKGGLMAVIGVILLLYSLIKLMSNVEATFNRIWWVAGSRSLIRKVTDYLTISLAAGVLVLFTGSANIFMAGRMKEVAGWLNLPEGLTKFIAMGGRVFPLLSIWLLFMFFYLIMPNTRVNPRAAAAGSIIAGSLSQFIQIVYLNFQVGVSGYNAIYGSFAAMPLFLIWLQTSWAVLLYGAQIAYAWENLDGGKSGTLTWETASIRLKKILALRVVRICVQRFADKTAPVSDVELARMLSLPLQLVRQLLGVLTRSGLLNEVIPVSAASARTGYAPAWDIECLTIMDVLDAVERVGGWEEGLGTSMACEAFEASFAEFETAARKSPGERKLKDI